MGLLMEVQVQVSESGY